MFTLIVVIFMIIAVAVFSVQNAMPIAVSFLAWRFEASLALVILLSAFAGMIIGVVAFSLMRFRRLSSKEKRDATRKPER